MSWGVSSQAQNISGKIVDTQGNALPGASVVLVTTPDSVLAKFAIASSNGSFTLKKPKPGKYNLKVSFTGFKTLNKPLSIITGQDYALGNVKLTEDKKLLDEIVVKDDRLPIVIKKDTIEYNAKAFRTKPNSNVEKLLKQLPGIEVGRDGQIKAQGKDVKKVLVDGKEFFGKDPKIATKNLPADAIDKVQVFDDKSEMSKFTGVDDGNREKTINLKLKKDHKQGYFGNVTAGYGTNDRYKGKLNLNRFNAKTQLSLLGTSNNINERPFSIMDYVNFMGGLGNMGSGGGNIEISGNSGIGAMLSMNSNEALATTGAVGANLNTDLSKNTSLHANYFYSAIANEINQNIYRETFLDSSSFYTNSQQDQTLRNWNHRMNFRLDHKINDKQRIRLYANVMYNEGNNNNYNLSENTQNNVLQSNTTRKILSNSQEVGINTRALYRKKFNKKGRVFVLSALFGVQNLNGEDYLNNAQNISGLSPLNVNQRQQLNNKRYSYDLQASFIEPIGGSKYLELKYQRNNYNNNSYKDFYATNQTPEFFIDSLSNRYTNEYTYDRGYVNLMYSRKNFNLTIGASTQYSSLNGVITTSETHINRNFLNILPSVRMRWSIDNSKSLEFDYNTNINAPRMQQLRPVVDNSNPSNVYQGNPNLEAEFAHRAGIMLHSFDQFSLTSLFVGVRGAYTQNKITTKVLTDASFNQFSQPLNVAYDASANGYLSFSTPLRWMGTKIRLSTRGRYSQGLVFVNDVQNTVSRQNNSIDVRLENFKKKRMDVRIGAKFTQNLTAYSDASELDRSFMQEDYYIQGDLDIGKTWELGGSFTQSVYTGEAFSGGAQTVPVFKAHIAKAMLKNRMQLKLSVFDILNRNQGITRNSNLNYVEERRVQTVGRYFMCSVSYSLTAMGGNKGTLLK